jgi:histidyl-tRNA synthetase
MDRDRAPSERPVDLVRGTRDWLPDEFERLAELESRLLAAFGEAGYRRIRTPVLEASELHERKSGAGIVSKLDELTGDGGPAVGRVVLRPELTASIVRAYVAAAEAPGLPWRVCMSGPVFRHQALGPGLDREFTQVGVERLGDGGPEADAELIALAETSLRRAGVSAPGVRVGHVGLILEVLERSGLPPAVRSSLVEIVSEAAASGRDVGAVESALERLSGWLLKGDADAIATADPADGGDDSAAVAKLFRQLVPDVTGRRSPVEILARLRRKWDVGRSLGEVLDRLSAQIRELAGLKGPAVDVVDRLKGEFGEWAPGSVAEILELVARLDDRGVSPSRVELDLGFGRGLGFYTQMIFELSATTTTGAAGPVEVCGGGRYDGLARVLGSARDPRGAGFAIGLERLLSVLDA